MRRRTRDFGHLKLIFAFLFISVFIPNVINALNSSATGNLGSFETGETGIKLCAQIDAGPADSLRFLVTNNQGFSADVLVGNDTCKNIKTIAATYTIREYLPQEYVLDSVTGGTVNADNTPFVATATGQYSIIYSNEYDQKGYLHSFGYTLSNQAASAVDVHFDANGGTGSMNTQRFGINSQQPLTANSFTRTDYNFAGWNTKADGTGTPYTDEQQISFATGGEITLFAQWRNVNLYNEITSRSNNGVDTNIDFTSKATITDGNGNGLNIRAGTENDQYPIYYFRGELSDNHVIWADKCWKVVRTTETGGTKMIYNGLPALVNGVQQCNATGVDSQITVNVNGADQNTFTFSDQGRSKSPADVGYMYGARIESNILLVNNSTTSFVFSNDVSRNGNTYTLDTSPGQSISGTWSAERFNAYSRYHYFCTDGATSCDNTKIAYIHHYIFSNDTILYISLDGYDDIEDAKAAMFANTTDSNAKAMVETWFEQQNLDGHIADTRNYEDDLEDTVFCNDRTYHSGGLKGKDSDEIQSGTTQSNYHGAYGRNVIKNANNNYEPSLDCVNSNDAFTVNPANGNGMLNHKIGLITADELTIAGNGDSGYDTTTYLYTGQFTWSASPRAFNTTSALVSAWRSPLGYGVPGDSIGLRPLVSLKNNIEFVSGTGLQTDPYIVE
ncbi:InlB B-repeat-containing protein [Candidatus Saccharibacteria bacterium]|nr:InlB B-repeat-containing protein [Candidatus Saccharibacteria bacterium]MBR3377712.1 InlB B-repeat-containing protein [Candidatus Saccharibacteria bacterium]